MNTQPTPSDIVAASKRNPYQTALDIQDAVNLSGIAHTFVEDVLPALWQEARDHGQGTRYVNTHDCVVLFIDKMADLAGVYTSNYETVGNAYRRVQEEAEKLAQS